MKTCFYSLLAATLLLSASRAAAQTSPTDTAYAPAPTMAAALPEPTPAAAAAPAPDSTARVLLTGYVLNEDKRPLQGATVLLKGTKEATSTDATGHYTLPVPPGTNTLQYDYAGYQGREVSASNFLPVTVTLTPAEKTRRRDRP